MAKFLRRTLITLVVLTAVLLLGDRVAAGFAENRIAAEVASTAANHGAYSDQRPDVTIHGFPFLTQAFGGEYRQIDIAMREVGADGLRFPTLDLVARDVTADWREVANRSADITADRVDAEGVIALDSLASLVDDYLSFDVHVSGDGTVTIEATLDMFGREVAVSGTGTIGLSDGALSIATDSFQAVEGVLPEGGQAVLDQFRSSLNTTVPLPELPYGIVLSEIEFSQDALRVSGSATDVTLA
jgi:hypothetical protein